MRTRRWNMASRTHLSRNRCYHLSYWIMGSATNEHEQVEDPSRHEITLIMDSNTLPFTLFKKMHPYPLPRLVHTYELTTFY
jgi:hypothetical protein